MNHTIPNFIHAIVYQKLQKCDGKWEDADRAVWLWGIETPCCMNCKFAMTSWPSTGHIIPTTHSQVHYF